MTTVASTYINEKNILCQENCYVQIGNEKNLIENFSLTNNKQYIDVDYCHFSNYNYNNDIYESTELNFVIPIRFYKNIEEYTNYNDKNKLDSDYVYKTNISL